MSERQWIVPSVAITLLSGGAGISLIPDRSGLWPALAILPAWMCCAALIAAVYGFLWMAVNGVERPVAEFRRIFIEHRRQVLAVAGVMLLAGLNMIAFMWVKPLLNYWMPFSADVWLANADNVLFLGHDPGRLLSAFAFPQAGLVYHPVWFALIILSLLIVATAPPSPEKSAAMLSYFALWSAVGPIIHSLLPAAGPVFYERLGLGDRFAAVDGGAETRQVADYLWNIYATRSFGAGAGISAMPSLHVTMAAWTVIVARTFAPRLTMPMAACALLIAILSVALGWHYAVDGIVGAGAALGCYLGFRELLRRRHYQVNRAIPFSPLAG